MHSINNFNLRYRADGSGKHIYFQVLTYNGQKTIIRCNPDTSSAKCVDRLPEGIPEVAPPPPIIQNKPGEPAKKKDCGCGKKEAKTSLVEKAKGAIKLGKAELGLNDVSLDVLNLRRSECNQCDKNEIGRCTECGCYLWAKTKLKNEKCPIGKW
jgi:hypothetical protein|tara:strand:- start:214 stop:675 length:462 start_codon:yes stop_codon:yes gene_type:complete